MTLPQSAFRQSPSPVPSHSDRAHVASAWEDPAPDFSSTSARVLGQPAEFSIKGFPRSGSPHFSPPEATSYSDAPPIPLSTTSTTTVTGPQRRLAIRSELTSTVPDVAESVVSRPQTGVHPSGNIFSIHRGRMGRHLSSSFNSAPRGYEPQVEGFLQAHLKTPSYRERVRRGRC